MFRKYFVLIFLILLFSNVFANELFLTEFGFSEKKVTEFNSIECFDLVVDFDYFQNKKNFSNLDNLHPILSIYANFVGKENDSSYISVELNGVRQVFWKENFVCKEDCVVRVFLEDFEKEKLNFCIRTGLSEITMLEKSKIGFYDTPVLEIVNVAPNEIVIGQRARMNINLINKGSKETDVFVQFVAENLRSLINITSFDIVEGDTSARTNIKPGESKNFFFYIKPVFVSSYNLPSSELFFENIFGEKQTILSNNSQLNVVEPNQAELIIFGEDFSEKNFSFIIKIINNWGEPLVGELNIFPQDIVFNSKKDLNINPFSEKSFSFVSKNLPSGEYFVSAELKTEDFNYVSKNVSFFINKKDYFFEIIFSFFAIIIASSIFILIYFSKK